MRAQPLDCDREYLARLENRLTMRKVLVELMDRFRVDALVYPFKSLTAPPLGTGDRGPRDNPVSAITGLSAIVASCRGGRRRTADLDRDPGAPVQ